MKNKAFIAMSGGVDSAVSALLMLREGYDCEGVTIRTFDSPEVDRDIEMARAICDRLSIKHRVLDLCDLFRTQVMDMFVREYELGNTPNPCLLCNRFIKLGAMFDILHREDPPALIATGHYAQIITDGDTNIIKASDSRKDQSYVLYRVRREVLPFVRFPLGGMTKDEVREIAERNGFVNAHKQDSQDICFVPDGDHAGFIRRMTGKDYPKGDFVFRDGTKLGEHKGVIAYTIGQRKGLGISYSEPLYVCGKDALTNTVTLGLNDDLFSTECEAVEVNLLDEGVKLLSGGNEVHVLAKTRYSHSEVGAVVRLEGDRLLCSFDTAVRAVTPGQGLVLYSDNILLGGGTIV